MFKNRPALLTVVCLIIGILIGKYFFSNLAYTISIYIIIFLLLISTLLIKRNYLLLKNILAIFLIISLGIIKITLDGKEFPPNHITKFLNLRDKIILSGIINEEPNWRNKKLVFPINVKRVFIAPDTFYVEGKILCSIKPDTLFDKTIKKLKYGDEIFAVGRLNEPRSARNPGEFDYKQYLTINNIYSFFYIDGFYSVIKKSNDNGSFIFNDIINPIRNHIIAKIDSTMGYIEGGFLKGLIVGDRTDIPDEIKESFINAGVIHILAVSGLNVAFVILILMAVFNFLPINERFRVILIIIALILYVFLTGATPSVIRAAIMGIVFLFGKTIERKPDNLNSLAVAAIIILIIDSKQIFDIGFQLSFLSVFSLVYFYPFFETCSFWKWKIFKYPLLKSTTGIIIAGFVVSLFLLPVLAMTTGKISIISLLANVLVIPISNFSLALGFIQIIAGLIWSPLYSIFSECNQFLLWFCLKIINFTGNLSFSYFEIYSFNSVKIILYYISIFAIFYYLKKNIKFALVFLAILVFNYLIWDFLTGNIKKNSMEITFIDVGQGDAALFQLPEKINVLIDTGPKDENFDAGEKIVYPYLRRNGISRIDYLILTHKHDDHIGGGLYLINKMNIGQILISPFEIHSVLSDSLNNLIKCKSIKISWISAGTKLSIGNCQLYFLNPSGKNLFNFNMNNNTRENNSSLAIKIVYGNVSVFMSGDIEGDAEQILVQHYREFLKSDILKVGHHGSRSSSSTEFLNSVRPKYSIISLSSFNVFRFPSPSTINRLRTINTEILRTDKDGAIIFSTDGNRLERIFWR
jgi:competence protein ComEC